MKLFRTYSSVFFLCFLILTPLPASAELQISSEQKPVKTSTATAPTKKPPKQIMAIIEYLKRANQKFDPAITNLLIGWTEIIQEPVEHYQNTGEKNRTGAIFTGLGEGLWNALGDTLMGALNFVTSPLPQFRFPLPENGVEVQKVTGEVPE